MRGCAVWLCLLVGVVAVPVVDNSACKNYGHTDCMGDCVWCNSDTGIMDGCFTKRIADGLPDSVYYCEAWVPEPKTEIADDETALMKELTMEMNKDSDISDFEASLAAGMENDFSSMPTVGASDDEEEMDDDVVSLNTAVDSLTTDDDSVFGDLNAEDDDEDDLKDYVGADEVKDEFEGDSDFDVLSLIGEVNQAMKDAEVADQKIFDKNQDILGLGKEEEVSDTSTEQMATDQMNNSQSPSDISVLDSESSESSEDDSDADSAELTMLRDSCGAAHSDQAACDADDACTWCDAGAVKSSCYTVENSHRLPSGVFECDSKSTKDLIASSEVPAPHPSFTGVSDIDALMKEARDAMISAETEESNEDESVRHVDMDTISDLMSESKHAMNDEDEREQSLLLGLEANPTTPMLGDSCGDAHDDPDACNADSACIWCVGGAIKSRCFTEENSARLPASVWSCSKDEVDEGDVVTDLMRESVEEMRNVDDERVSDEAMNVALSPLTTPSATTPMLGDSCGDAHDNPDACNADSACIWCVGGAIKSRCFTVENSARLPASVWSCSKDEVDEGDDDDVVTDLISQSLHEMRGASDDDSVSVQAQMDSIVKEGESEGERVSKEEVAGQALVGVEAEPKKDEEVMQELEHSDVYDDFQDLRRERAQVQQAKDDTPSDDSEETDSGLTDAELLRAVSEMVDGVYSMAISSHSVPSNTSLMSCLNVTSAQSLFRSFSHVAMALKGDESGEPGLLGVLDGLQGLGSVMVDLVEVGKDCGLSVKEVRVLQKLHDKLANPNAVQYRAGKQLVVDNIDMLGDVKGAVWDYDKQLWGGFGFKLGVALGRLSGTGEVGAIEKHSRIRARAIPSPQHAKNQKSHTARAHRQ